MLSYSSLHNVYSVQYNFRRIVRAQTYIKFKKNIAVNIFLDTQVTLAPIPVRRSVRLSVRNSFGFPFCQRLWDLTKRLDDIGVANMVADMAAEMEVDKVADMVADMAADKK